MLFSEVLVSQHVKDMLINTVKNKRVSHAQLFLCQAGMPGLALALAYCQYISCPDRTGTDACGKCASCIKFDNLVHADMHFVFPNEKNASGKSNIPAYLGQWRELLKEKKGLITQYQWAEYIKAGKSLAIYERDIMDLINVLQSKPYESEYRFVIIWLPELMNETAANKLLKTLEEPDGKTLIILVSENTDNILPTILSRTQMLKINKLPTEDFVSVVSKLINCDSGQARIIGYITDFNLQQALEMGVNVVDVENYEYFVSMMRSAYALYHMQAHKVDFKGVEDWLKSMEELEKAACVNYLKYSLNMIRKCMIMNTDAASLIQLSPNEETFLKSFSPFVNLENGRQIMNVLDDAVKKLTVNNANVKMLFTDILLQTGKLLNKKGQ